MNNEIKLDTKLVGDITGDFYVPSYQRGYRWGETEVVRLLDDIYSTEGKRNYCLQPVVVRKNGDRYEYLRYIQTGRRIHCHRIQGAEWKR